MTGHDIIAIGTSAGGVEALRELVRGLPPGLPAALFIVCHFPSREVSRLPDILSREGPLLAAHARNGEPIYPGHIQVAPPDHHMVLREGVVHINRGPRENRFRPAIDPMFRSAARAYGPRVVGVLLSGTLLDGVAGLVDVRLAGGLAVLQDPEDAVFALLPRAAKETAGADHIVPARTMAQLLVDLVHQPVSSPGITWKDSSERASAAVVATHQQTDAS